MCWLIRIWCHAGPQSSPRAVGEGGSQEQSSAGTPKPEQGSAAGSQHAARHGRGLIETNVTRSGHLGSEDVPRQTGAGESRQSSSTGSKGQERAIAEVLRDSPPNSGVDRDSVRLDLAYPRVAGLGAAPLRSPFCSDNSDPPTPRLRLALPAAAQDARSSSAPAQGQVQSARKSPQPGSASSSPEHATADSQHADLPPSSPAFPFGPAGGLPDGTASSQPPQHDKQTEAERLQEQSTASQAAPAESPPQASTAPQMPSWLLAELRSPSRRGLQVCFCSPALPQSLIGNGSAGTDT